MLNNFSEKKYKELVRIGDGIFAKDNKSESTTQKDVQVNNTPFSKIPTPLKWAGGIVAVLGVAWIGWKLVMILVRLLAWIFH